MKITICYTYSPALVGRIFVATAKRETSLSITVGGEQLSPETRAHALVALVGGPHYSLDFYSPKIAERHDPEPLSVCELAVSHASPVEEVPTVERAIADVSAMIRRAAEEASDLLARRTEIVAKADAESARKRAAEKAAKEEEIAELLAKGVDVFLARKGASWSITTGGADYDTRRDYRVVALELAAEVEAKRRNAESAALEAAWVAEHAPDLLPRYAEDLHRAGEVEDRMRAWAFAPLDGFPRYAKIKGAEIGHHEDCFDPEYTFGVDDATKHGITDEQYETLRQIREAAKKACPPGPREHLGYKLAHPETRVEHRVHRGQCDHDCCEDAVIRPSALVTVTVCGRELSREYAL